jgi:hypothetical protein
MPAAGAFSVRVLSSQGQGVRNFHGWCRRRCRCSGGCAQTIPSKQLGDRRGGLVEKLQRRRTTDGLTDCRRWRTSLLFAAFATFAAAFAPPVPLVSDLLHLAALNQRQRERQPRLQI